MSPWFTVTDLEKITKERSREEVEPGVLGAGGNPVPVTVPVSPSA